MYFLLRKITAYSGDEGEEHEVLVVPFPDAVRDEKAMAFQKRKRVNNGISNMRNENKIIRYDILDFRFLRNKAKSAF